MSAQVIEADLTWTEGGFTPGVRVAVGADGRITAVGTDHRPTRRLAGRALLPGMVSAHSHAFQRGLRGQGERFPEGAGSFWTWRDAMYRLVTSLDREHFHALSLRAFREMLDAGITAVGEFHYFHHSSAGSDFAFDDAILEAASEAGIRLVLLSAYYRTGGIGQPLDTAQRRFETQSPEQYWEQMDRLARSLEPSRQQLGVAVHSIRAADLNDLAHLHAEAARRGLPFHMHVEEQRREIEECLAAYHKRPMALLNETLDIAGNLTGVHCTHTVSHDMTQFLDAGGSVCLCPLTEANLGDGRPDITQLRELPERVCLGTDSNARISMLEEMRWLEYVQRLGMETRGAFSEASGWPARQLFEAATVNGARALHLDAGRITPGAWADFCTVDLEHPTLAAADPGPLLDALVFGAGNEVMAETCVGGSWRTTGES